VLNTSTFTLLTVLCYTSYTFSTSRFGGNARLVFSSKQEDELSKLNADIRIVTVENALNAFLGMTSDTSDVLHIRVHRDLVRKRITFASRYIEQRIIQEALQQPKYDVNRFRPLACLSNGLDVL
jgi:hypothetical protein